MKIDITALVKSIVAIVVLGAALILAQLWFDVFPEAVFGKLLVTLLILGGVVSFIIAVKQDLSEEKKLKDDKYIG